jgi:hypothetical protein
MTGHISSVSEWSPVNIARIFNVILIPFAVLYRLIYYVF